MVPKNNSLLSLVLIFTILQETPAASATNDWSQPCFSGTCSYDLPETATGPSGTLQIWGAQSAIGDITTAGGWEIVSCDPSSLAQVVTVVCKSSDDSASCAHLFDGAAIPEASNSAVRRAIASSTTVVSPTSSGSAVGVSGSVLSSDGQEQGAVGKIVRLPENCGKSAFARISKAWIPSNQTIPPSIARRLVRRDGETPVVKAFSMDVDFGSSDARHGPVGFALVGANVPGASGIDISSLATNNNNSTQSRRSYHTQRGLGDLIHHVVDSVSSLNDFNFTNSTTLPPLDFDKSFNLVNQQIDCSADVPVGGLNSSIGVNGQVKVDVDANVHAVISVGIVATGTIVPPNVEQFGLTSGFTADINGSIIMSAGVGGTLDSGKIPIFQIGVPGLVVPGVFSIGPTFEIDAEAKASLDLDIDMTVGVNYHITNAQFVFPDGGNQGGIFAPDDTPLSLSVQPSGTATGTVEVHLIPTVNFGIDAFGGTIGANVFVNLDASTTATLTLGASGAEQNVTLGTRSEHQASDIAAGRVGRLGYPAAHIRGRNLIGEAYFHSKRNPEPFGFGSIVSGVENAGKKVGSAVEGAAQKVGSAVASVVDGIEGKTTDSNALKTPSATTPAVATTASGSLAPAATTSGANKVLVPATGDSGAGFGGCVEMDIGLNANVGADADFFGLFNPSTSLSLFNKTFTLFQKCFGDSSEVQRRSESDAFRRFKQMRRAFDLKCNSPTAGISQLVDEVVSASQLV